MHDSRLDFKQSEQTVQYHSSIWIGGQKNYSAITKKKKNLSIVLCITKFQDDLINKKFRLQIDCKTTKDVLQKIQNKFLQDGKFDFQISISKSNLLKEKKICYQIF